MGNTLYICNQDRENIEYNTNNNVVIVKENNINNNNNNKNTMIITTVDKSNNELWCDFLFVEYRHAPIAFNIKRVDKGLRKAFKQYMNAHYNDNTTDANIDALLKKKLLIFFENIDESEREIMNEVIKKAAKIRLQRILERVFLALDPFNKGLIKVKLVQYWLELDRSWDINYGVPYEKINKILQQLERAPKSIDKRTFMNLFQDWGLIESLHITPDGLFYERLSMYAVAPGKRGEDRLIATQRTDSIHDRRKSVSTYFALQQQQAFV